MIGQRLAMMDRLLTALPCRTDMERRVAFDVLDRNGHICLLLRRSASIFFGICCLRFVAGEKYACGIEWIECLHGKKKGVSYAADPMWPLHWDIHLHQWQIGYLNGVLFLALTPYNREYCPDFYSRSKRLMHSHLLCDVDMRPDALLVYCEGSGRLQ